MEVSREFLEALRQFADSSGSRYDSEGMWLTPGLQRLIDEINRLLAQERE